MLRVGAEGAEWKKHVAAFSFLDTTSNVQSKQSSAHLSASKRDDQHGVL